MEEVSKKENLESISIFQLPGEPAVVINGVPPITLTDGNLVPCETVSEIGSHQTIVFGEWLVGRKVQKLFGKKLFNGKVTEFDKEAFWYRVVYDDGDFEDLEWPELQELLLPLDITLPLKAVASKVIKKRQKNCKKPGISVSQLRINQTQ